MDFLSISHSITLVLCLGSLVRFFILLATHFYWAIVSFHFVLLFQTKNTFFMYEVHQAPSIHEGGRMIRNYPTWDFDLVWTTIDS